MERKDDGLPYDPAYYVGKRAVWAIAVRNQGTVTVFVKIVDARRSFDRVDLLIETDTGDRCWVSSKTVEVRRK